MEKNASLFIIGHEHFNKSLTLDIENRLMHYMMSAERVKHVHNLRDNPQASYYPMEEIQHEVRVLMTRGVNRLYIYACDPELQKALLRAEKER